MILLALVAASCAAVVGGVFIFTWGDDYLPLRVALGVGFLALTIAAISFMGAAAQ
jgi:hypothetical protein